MVSALSARLLQHYGGNNPNRAQSVTSNNNSVALSTRSSATSAMTARSSPRSASDDDQQYHQERYPHTITLDLDVRGSLKNNKNTKRQRISDEDHYRAHTVTLDLKRGGVTPVSLAPTLRSYRGGFDYTYVKHLTSKNYDAMNLHAASSKEKSKIQSLINVETNCEALFNSCRSFYSLPSNNATSSAGNNSDSDSDLTCTESNFSVNDSDSIEGNSSKAIDSSALEPFQSKLDWKNKYEIMNKKDQMSLNSTTLIERSISSVMTLAKAMDFSPMPRVITKATPPFQVVHGNSAYIRLTGVQSNEIVGFPFETFIESCKTSLSLKSCARMSEMGKAVIMDVITRNEKRSDEGSTFAKNYMKCAVHVTPLVSSSGRKRKATPSTEESMGNSKKNAREVFNVSHFLVEIESVDSENELGHKDVIKKEEYELFHTNTQSIIG